MDIFSLGVMCVRNDKSYSLHSIWECLTRTKPWAELKQPLALKVEKKLTAGERPVCPTFPFKPHLPQIIPETTPPLLRELITACWAYKPNERPTAEDLITKIFPKVKEVLCPELIAKQAARPQLGYERGRAMAAGTPPLGSCYCTCSH